MAIIEYNDEQGVKSNAVSKVGFVKLNVGNNKVRLIGNPITFYQHRFLEFSYVKDGETKKSKRNIVCIGKDKCPICKVIGDNKEHGNRAARRNVRYVIDRTDGEIKILDYGVGIRDGIQALFKNEDKVDEKGTPFDYDIVIIKTKGDGDKISYSVQDAKKLALTKVEQDAVTNLVPLVERYKENTAEEILEMNLDIFKTGVFVEQEILEEEIPF